MGFCFATFVCSTCRHSIFGRPSTIAPMETMAELDTDQDLEDIGGLSSTISSSGARRDRSMSCNRPALQSPSMSATIESSETMRASSNPNVLVMESIA